MLSNSSVETRDSSIQILDTFITQLDFQSNSNPLGAADASVISLAAASAVILATKIHEIRPLCTVSVNDLFQVCDATDYSHENCLLLESYLLTVSRSTSKSLLQNSSGTSCPPSSQIFRILRRNSSSTLRDGYS